MDSHSKLRAGKILTVHEEAQALAALGAIIGKASNLLMTVAELYSPQDDAFSGGNGFAAHAMTATNALLLEASRAVSELHYGLEERARREARMEAERQDAIAALHVPNPNLDAEADSEEIIAWTPAAAAVAPDAPEVSEVPPAEQSDQRFATTYHELLQRLTDVEVFANDQDMQAVPHAREKLLPLVQGLREELQRLGRVA